MEMEMCVRNKDSSGKLTFCLQYIYQYCVTIDILNFFPLVPSDTQVFNYCFPNTHYSLKHWLYNLYKGSVQYDKVSTVSKCSTKSYLSRATLWSHGYRFGSPWLHSRSESNLDYQSQFECTNQQQHGWFRPGWVAQLLRVENNSEALRNCSTGLGSNLLNLFSLFNAMKFYKLLCPAKY